MSVSNPHHGGARDSGSAPADPGRPSTDGAVTTDEPAASAGPLIRPERLVAFADAVIAIAITLLVIPLAELVPQAAERGLPASAVLDEHGTEVGAFLVSFATIVQLWMVHHGMMRRITSISVPFIAVTMFWLLLVVVLPFFTQLIGVYGGEPFAVRSFTAIWLLIGVTHPALAALGQAFRRRMLMWPALLVICLAVELAFPQFGYYPLVLLLVAPLIVVSIFGSWA